MEFQSEPRRLFPPEAVTKMLILCAIDLSFSRVHSLKILLWTVMSSQRWIFIITCGALLSPPARGKNAYARRPGYSVASTASVAPNDTPTRIK